MTASRPSMDAQRFDVVIVGGRVAGCAMAIRLARSGLSVALIERDPVPSETLSTHLIQDVSLFEELGVLREVMACGAPPLREVTIHLEDADLSAATVDRPWLCLRRISLDAVLHRAARDAGTEMFEETAVVSALWSGGRVSGVVAQRRDGTRFALSARLVVGADGRNSTVARLVGAERYDVRPNERTAYWGYFAGIPMPNVFHLARRGRDMILSAPCDDGMTLVAAQPPLDDDRDWRDPSVLVSVASQLVGPLRGTLDEAKLMGGMRSVRRMDGFFRAGAGPGWALVGDAGHFKDIVVGQGICDALRQARGLSRCLTKESLRDPARLDAALNSWWRERDADARPMSWLAQDLGRVETTVLDHELLRVLAGSTRYRRHLQEVLARRRPPAHVVGRAVQSHALARAALHTSRADLRDAVAGALGRERDRLSIGRRATFGT